MFGAIAKDKAPDPALNRKKEKAFISSIKFLVCLAFSLFIFISVFVGFGYLYLRPMVSGIRTELLLPNFVEPTEIDFIRLQEKLLTNKNTANPSWNFTEGEFNALLSSVRVPPIKGFCLNRIKHYFKDQKNVRYYLIGSGYTLKKLVLSFEIRGSKEAEIANLQINSYQVPKEHWLYNYTANIIKEIAIADKDGLLERLMKKDMLPYNI